MPSSRSFLKLGTWLKGRRKKKSNPNTIPLSSVNGIPSSQSLSQQNIIASTTPTQIPASSSLPSLHPPPTPASSAWNDSHWKKAVEKTKEKLGDDKIFLQFSSEDSLSAAITHTEIVCRKAESEQWIHTDKIHRVLRSLQVFAHVGDICIQHSPEVTSLVWGSVRFLLQYGINILDTRKELLDALGVIIKKIAVCEYYSRMTEELQSGITQTMSMDALKEIFDGCLTEFYVAVLVFIVKATRYFTSRTGPGGLTNTSERALRGFEQYSAYFKPFMDEIEKHESTVKECSCISEISARKESTKRVSEIHSIITELEKLWGTLLNDIRHGIDTANEGIEGIKHGIVKILNDDEKKKLRKCRKWLNFFDPDSEYKIHRRAQMDGTGLWIFNDSTFNEWLKTKEGVLWIRGKPGSGKSVLTSFIIERLRNYASTANDQSVHLYFFFRNGGDRTAGIATMLASLIEQLFRSADEANQQRLLNIIEPSFNRYCSSICPVDELWRLLSAMIESFAKPLMVFLDALDECIDPDSVINRLNSVKARALVTSRPESNIYEAFERHPPNHIVQMDVRHDIEMFVTSKVRDDNRLKPHRDAIISKVKQTADGMFRYAGLMLEELRRTSHQRKVTEILQSLPNGLSEMYSLMLQRLPPELAPLRRITFKFISGSFRPVTIEEIAYANAVKPGEDFDPHEVLLATKKEILETCGSLVEVFESTIIESDYIEAEPLEVLRFSHLTVKDFLLSRPNVMYTTNSCDDSESRVDHLLQANIRLHASIASVCVSLLSEKALLAESNNCRSMDSPLLYAVMYGLRHASIAMPDGVVHSRTLPSDLQRLLKKNAPRFHLWRASIPLGALPDTPLYFDDESEQQSLEPLHLMAYYGFINLLQDGVEAEHDINIAPDNGKTSLMWAALNGHAKAVELLLAQNGVDINKADNDGRTPLWEATRSGNAEVVKLLLAQDGVDINKADNSGRTPLLEAAWVGHAEVVKLLLAQDGVDINKTDNDGKTPLWEASMRGHVEVVEFLLTQDWVDMNQTDSNGDTPLSIAEKEGHQAIVDMLKARMESSSSSRTPSP